jgi:hypothetical protein
VAGPSWRGGGGPFRGGSGRGGGDHGGGGQGGGGLRIGGFRGRVCGGDRGGRVLYSLLLLADSNYGTNKHTVCVFITAGPSTKVFTWGGGGIWEDMCYERRRAEACVDCVKEGGGEEGKC